MAEPVKNLPSMTTDEFLRWYSEQPEGMRYELLDGVVYPRNHKAAIQGGRPIEMQGERVIHGRLKTRIVNRFSAGIESRKLPCEAFADGMAVRVGPSTTFEPDVVVRCGPKAPGDAIVFEDATIVVDVTSPSTKRLDTAQKLVRCFRNPTIVHYLIVVSESDRGIIHHRRDESGAIKTAIWETGLLNLDPPGLTLDIDALYAET